jgi:hypothetical protein
MQGEKDGGGEEEKDLEGAENTGRIRVRLVH